MSAHTKSNYCACDPENGPPEDEADGCGKCGDGPIAPPQTAPQLWEMVRDYQLEKNNAEADAAMCRGERDAAQRVVADLRASLDDGSIAGLQAELAAIKEERNTALDKMHAIRSENERIRALLAEGKLLAAMEPDACAEIGWIQDLVKESVRDVAAEWESARRDLAAMKNERDAALHAAGVRLTQLVELEAERNEKAAMLTKAWNDIRDVTRRNEVLREEVERRALDREIALRELKEASAPDLLAACEASVSHCRLNCTPESYCAQCEPLLAAIASARGLK